MEAQNPHDQNLRNIIEERELPSRQHSVTGFDEENHRIYASFTIARKLYRCTSCADQIEIGAEHVVTQALVKRGGYDHHHVHNECFSEGVLPSLGRIAVVKASETSQEKMNKRASRARYKARKRSR